MKSLVEFRRGKSRQPIAILTTYDALTARLATAAGADALLVGDSLAMVVHGFPSTVHATLEMMLLHTAAVRRGSPDIVVIADLPFLACRRGIVSAVDAAGALIQAGATAVKLEGLAGHADVVAHLVGSGIPVMGHVGLTPQSIHQLGGYHVQARQPTAARTLREECLRLEALGAFSIVLECIPRALARRVTRVLTIPTIGIGAGPDTSGQVLVSTDVLGLDERFRPRFARRYLEGHDVLTAAFRAYVADVHAARFPTPAEVLA